MRFLLLALALGTAAGFTRAAPVPKEVLKKFPDYYPLLPGTEWVYKVGESEIAVKVTDYAKKGAVRTGDLATVVDGRVVATESIRVDETGVYRTHINKTKIEPPVLVLKFGIKDETEWATKSQVGGAEVDFVFKLVGQEDADVPAGKYKAVKVTGSGAIAGTDAQTVYHFADGVGIVKLTYGAAGAEAVMALKKFTPGRDAK